MGANPLRKHQRVRYNRINESLQLAAVQNLRVHRIHLFIAQEELNKSSKYQIVYSSLSLNNRSSCADGHVCLTFVTLHEP
jgi:hypothetical protein